MTARARLGPLLLSCLLVACGGEEEPGEPPPAAPDVRGPARRPDPPDDRPPDRPDDRPPDRPDDRPPPDAARTAVERLAAGQRLYERDCAACHGYDGGGDGHNTRQFDSPALPSLRRQLTDDQRRMALEMGAGSPADAPWQIMPAYADSYSEDEMAAVLAYVENLPDRRVDAEINLAGSDDLKCQPCHRSEGLRLLEELNCAGCHTHPALERRIVAPDLSEVGDRYTKAWVRAFLFRPFNRRHLGFRPGETNRMPNFSLTADECRALTEFLASQHRETPLPAAPEVPGGNAALLGERVFRTKGCVACHQVGSYGGRIGPDLSGIGLRLRADWMAAYLDDPRALVPETSMPRVAMAPIERGLLMAYLLDQRSQFPGIINPISEGAGSDVRPERLRPLQGVDRYDEPGEEERAVLVAAGERLFADLGCNGCHPLRGHEFEPSGRVGPDLRAAGQRLDKDWFYDYLLTPASLRPRHAARMPRFGLTGAEIVDVYYTLIDLGPPDLVSAIAAHAGPAGDPVIGRRLLTEKDCHSCHRFGDEDLGPVGSYYFEGSEQEEKERWAPDLIHSGRIARGALWTQIHDPTVIDPAARMPKIGLSEEEVDHLVAFLRQKR